MVWIRVLIPLLALTLTAAGPAAKPEDLIAQKQFAQAVASLEKQKAQGNAEARRQFLLARAYAGQSRFNAAIASISKAIALQPDNATNCFNRACYQARAGLTTDARASLRALIQRLAKTPGETGRFRRLLASDPDLANLRNQTSDWKALIATLPAPRRDVASDMEAPETLEHVTESQRYEAMTPEALVAGLERLATNSNTAFDMYHAAETLRDRSLGAPLRARLAALIKSSAPNWEERSELLIAFANHALDWQEFRQAYTWVAMHAKNSDDRRLAGNAFKDAYAPAYADEIAAIVIHIVPHENDFGALEPWFGSLMEDDITAKLSASRQSLRPGTFDKIRHAFLDAANKRPLTGADYYSGLFVLDHSPKTLSEIASAARDTSRSIPERLDAVRAAKFISCEPTESFCRMLVKLVQSKDDARIRAEAIERLASLKYGKSAVRAARNDPDEKVREAAESAAECYDEDTDCM